MCSILSVRRTWPARLAAAVLFAVAAAALVQAVGNRRANEQAELGSASTFVPTIPRRAGGEDLAHARSGTFDDTTVVVTAGPFTPVAIYEMLSENGLGAMGEDLTVRVQDAFPPTRVTVERDLTVRSVPPATIWLDAWRGSDFLRQPERSIAHQIGLLWATRYLAGNDRFWRAYLRLRGLDGDRRLRSSALWDPNEIFADDYRLLFGSSGAIAQQPRHLNPALPDPASVAGLQDLIVSFLPAAR